jgi:HTH-type transcriptional regulator/antitoxin HigA
MATASWLRLGEIEATQIKTGPFDRAKFRAGLDAVRAAMREHPDHSMTEAREICRDAGVAFVVHAGLQAGRYLASVEAHRQVQI